MYYFFKCDKTWFGWSVILFYGVSTLYGLFNAELSHFDKFQAIQFSISFVYTQLNVKTVNSKQSILA